MNLGLLKTVRGISVIEVMVTLAIIAVLAGVAVPGMNKQMPKHRLNGAVKQVSWDLMSARIDAIRKKLNVKFSVISADEYQIWIDMDKDSVEDSNEITITNIHNDYYDVNITSPKSPTFKSTGTVINRPDTLQPINLVNSSGSKTITITSGGLVRVN